MRRKTRRKKRTRKSLRSTGLKVLLAAAVTAGTYTYSTDAQAVPRVLREGTRPMFFHLGFGGDWHLYHRYYADNPNRYFRYNRFRLHQEFGGHFRGGAEGPALAIVTQEGFPNYGRYYRDGRDVSLQVKGKFLWDIRVKRGLGFYISPFGTVGWHGWLGDGYWYREYRYRHSATTSIGVTGKLILDDRWVVWLQVPTVEFFFNNVDWYARFSVFTGAGVIF